jgi:hypothetical protein
MFENQARAKRYNISKALFVCKMIEGSPVNPHVIKMVGYMMTLSKVGCEITDDLATDVILQSLPVSYASFIMNFHMNGIEKPWLSCMGCSKQPRIALRRTPIM